MTGTRRGRCAAALLGLGITGMLLSGCGHAAPAVEGRGTARLPPETITVGCVTYASEGQQVWTHPYVGDQRDIAAPLEKIADTHPDEVAGTAFCSDYVGFAIFITPDSPQAVAEVNALKRELPDARIDVHQVPHSMNEMLHFIEQIDTNKARMIRGIAPNIYTGGLTIDIADPSQEAQARQVVRELVGKIPVSIQITRGTVTPVPNPTDPNTPRSRLPSYASAPFEKCATAVLPPNRTKHQFGIA